MTTCECSAADILREGGALSHLVDNFAPRVGQVAMAQAVTACIKSGDTLCVEAGTGTGKTFAYLLPVLLSKKKSIISTGTKNLQDQLFYKDLPRMIEATDARPKVAILKGRANYVCLYRLDLTFESGRLHDKESVRDLQTITKWSHSTVTGDIAEVSDVAEDSKIWPHVTSHEGNCLGAECPLFNKCYVVKARRHAASADIVVINHHLFFADLSLRDREVGEILPEVDIIVFDEAHQMPDIATHFFDQRFSSRLLLDLADDLESEALKVARDVQDSLSTLAKRLRQSAQDMRLALGAEMRRDVWQRVKDDAKRAIESVKVALRAFVKLLETVSDLSEGLAACHERSLEAMVLFDSLTSKVAEDSIHWFETYRKIFVLHATPITVGKEFQAYLDKSKAAKIFTSATLTIDDDFSFFQSHLNLQSANTLTVDSPFDFASLAKFYTPRYLPMPNDSSYTEKVIEAVTPILEAVKGRSFILFTSHYALQVAAGILKNKVEFPLFVQGEKSKRELLEGFTHSGNGILLGTNSFWEGVDIRGDALSCVIIDKLPFASHHDPITKARIERLKKQGENAFLRYQLPRAVLSLKQGVGRLIRDVADRGLLVVCDPRLVVKEYGDTFISSLPRIPRTRDEDIALAFAGTL